ncbi:MAG: hybrid sensor histidine kinase/response regulator, partial [Chloroflexia bacterium]|nr:hybrid sensor histidine kinase/response regulator [Chloroflexia bacterium]
TMAEVLPADLAATFTAAIGSVLDSGGTQTLEYRLVLNERPQDFEARLVAAGTDEVVAVVRDITDRKRLEGKLREALDAAHAANRATSQLLAMMSHELRTPMQAVLGYAELLLAGPQGSLTPEQTEDVRLIQQGARRLIGFVRQMLDLSRLEAGQMGLKTEAVDLAKIVDEVRQDVAPQATEKGIALRIDLPLNLPAALGDAMGVRQIVLNLVSNAVKFTEQGEVRISARTSDGRVEVKVADTGIGIAKNTLPHIFDEFRQADAGMTRRYDGAGLGLAIAKRLAEQQAGEIHVTSKLGAGSTFTLQLPVATPQT